MEENRSTAFDRVLLPQEDDTAAVAVAATGHRRRRTSPPPTSTDRGTPLPPCISISSASPLPLPQWLTGSLPPLLARCQDLWGRCCRHDGIAGSVAAGFAFFQAATGSGELRGRPPSSFSAARRALSLPVSLLLLLLAGPARERRPADRLGKKEEVKVEIEIGRDKECFPWGTA